MIFSRWLESQQETLPEILYHITPVAQKILREGFKTAMQHGEGETLGGMYSHAVSFTYNLENAKDYRDGLEILQTALRGNYYRWDEDAYMLAHHYNYSTKEAEYFIKIIKEDDFREFEDYYRRYPEKLVGETKRKYDIERMTAFIRQLALNWRPAKGRPRMPWAFRNHWERIKNAQEFSILSVSTRPGNGKPGPQKFSANPGEEEFRIYDPENFDNTTIKLIPHD